VRERFVTLTEKAIDAIKQVAPGEAGVRLFASDAPGDAAAGLHLEVVEEPVRGDEVVDIQGAHVFLDPTAATLVEDKVLDATSQGTRVQFALTDRP
jgi:Fe-S cluster assembly iron-binding protein IscA